MLQAHTVWHTWGITLLQGGRKSNGSSDYTEGLEWQRMVTEQFPLGLMSWLSVESLAATEPSGICVILEWSLRNWSCSTSQLCKDCWPLEIYRGNQNQIWEYLLGDETGRVCYFPFQGIPPFRHLFFFCNALLKFLLKLCLETNKSSQDGQSVKCSCLLYLLPVHV